MSEKREPNLWTLDDGRVVALIREEDLPDVPEGTRLLSIMGREAVVGRDEVDTDTRGGWLAYGTIVEDRTYEQRVTKLAEKLIEVAPPLFVRALSDEGEGPTAVAMSHLIECVERGR